MKQTLDNNPYESGGLGHCERNKSANRLLERKEEYIQNKEHRFFAAANRLQLAISGQSHDIFAIDVYYHQSCYLKFAINEQRRQKQIDDDLEDIQNDVMSEIFGKILTKILREKQAFLLSDLLRDVMNLSDEKGVDSPVNNTAALKKKLVGVFSERLGFYSSGRQVIIYSSDVNPLEYATATLKGHGLRGLPVSKLLRVMKELDIGHIYAHADEQVYARLAHILLKYPDCKGYKSWWTDAGVIAMGSVDKAAEGGHYHRNIRLHKECFCALVQFRVESLTAKYTDIDAGLIALFQYLKHNPSPSLNKEVVENAKFHQNSIISSVDGTQSKMSIEYLKDVSSLLTLVSAVCGKKKARLPSRS